MEQNPEHGLTLKSQPLSSSRHRPRRLLISLLTLFILGIVCLWWWDLHRVPELRLIMKYPIYELWQMWSPYGFIARERGKLPKEYYFVSYNMKGQVISRTNIIARGSHDGPSVEQSIMSPNRHWLLVMSPFGNGEMANVSLWHDGSIVRQEILPACPFIVMRDDGTGWLLGYAGQTLYLYALKQKHVLVAHDNLRMGHSNDDMWNTILLDCEIIADSAAGVPSWGLEGCSLSLDSTTLRISAYRRENAEQSTQFPSYLTYHINYDGTRLKMRRIGIDAKHQYLEGGSLIGPSLKPSYATPTPAPKSGIPPEAIITMTSGKQWIIPQWRKYPDIWRKEQTQDGHFALVSYGKGIYWRNVIPSFIHPWIVRWDKTRWLDQGKADVILELFEQPGILRAQTRIPVEYIVANYFPDIAISPDGRNQVIFVRGNVFLYTLD